MLRRICLCKTQLNDALIESYGSLDKKTAARCGAAARVVLVTPLSRAEKTAKFLLRLGFIFER